MATYPGWNSFDPDSVGHDFFHNFLCDLLSSTTPDGRQNLVGAGFMNLGISVLVLGALLPLWWSVPLTGAWQLASRVLGAIAATLTLAICIEQALGLKWSHNVLTLSAGAAGLVPTMLVAWTDWRSVDATRTRRLLLGGVVLFSLANFVSYSLVQLGGTLTSFVPTTQKLALLCLVGWLCLKPATQVKNA